ncbi:hypothetical protein MD484_g441, partial [Candolleomyces efflorescens]
MSSSPDKPFSFDERLGIYLSVQSACLSGAAVLILLTYAFIRWRKRRGNTSVESDASGSEIFLTLMLADLLQAIGNLPSIRWMRDGYVTEGSLCTAQAVIKQIGINGVALSSFFIALHTFGVLVLRWKVHRHASKVGVALIWVFIGIVVGIPNAVHRNDVYYGDTQYWCWIKTEFKAAQILSEYLWVWSSAIIMTVLYGIMFLFMRGFLVIGGGKGLRWKRESRVRLDLEGGDDEEERAARAMANLLLFYPAVYILCVLPNTLSRWLYFSGYNVPFQFTLAASSLFGFSGLFNVILYFSTRKEYAVGPSVSVTGATYPSTAHHHGYLPPDKEASQISNSREDVGYELEERNYGRQQTLSYQSGPSPNANSTALSPNLILHNTSPLHQSPSSRTVPLGQAHGPSPPNSAGHPAGRGNTVNSGYQLDDDENDYGRLPG